MSGRSGAWPDRLLALLVGVLLGTGAGAPASTAQSPATQSNGADLTRVPSSRVDALYVARGVSITPYEKLLIDPVWVTYEPKWKQRHPEVDSENARKLRGFIAASFTDVLVHELQQTGTYAIVYQPGPGVLRVRPKIVNLDIAAPDLPAPASENRYVLSPGEMTLLVELYDSRTGTLLARAVDRKAGRETGSVQIANADTNAANTRRVFTVWADALRDGLDAARAPGTSEAEAPTPTGR